VLLTATELTQEREKPRMGDAELLNLIPCEWGIR
jgi:hypothetical protein